MIQIEEIESIPTLDWSDWSWDEFRCGNAAMMERRSLKMVVALDDALPLFVLGLIYNNFLSPPWVWLLMTKQMLGAPPSLFRDLREVSANLPPSLTLVNTLFTEGKRFLRFFGFEPIDHVTRYDSREYEVYRRD